MDNNDKNYEEEQISQFCDTLMNVTGAISNLRESKDSAIVLCSDGRYMNSRMCGIYPNVLNMVFMKMLNDDKFAELIVEAAMMYSHHIQHPEPQPKADDSQENENETLIDFN